MPRVNGSLVTEADMNGEFAPKPGHTPGTDNTIILNCQQVINRYYADVEDYSANRMPSWDQITRDTYTQQFTRENLAPLFTGNNQFFFSYYVDGVAKITVGFPSYPGSAGGATGMVPYGSDRAIVVRNNGPATVKCTISHEISGTWIPYSVFTVPNDNQLSDPKQNNYEFPFKVTIEPA